MSDVNTAASTVPSSSPTSIDAAFDSAWSEASKESTPKEETPAASPADTSTPEPEPEPKAEAKPDDTLIDEDLELAVSREELEAIKKDPVLSKLYKNFQKGATQKFQQIASQKRILEEYSRDPEGFARRLAQHHGLNLAPPPPPTPAGEAVDEVMEEMTGLFGAEAAKALKPMFEKLVGNVLQKEVAPIKEQQEQMRMLGAAKQAEAVTGTFRAKHQDITPEIEQKMVELGQRFQPAEDIDPGEYLDSLYLLATAGRVKAETSKEVVERMKKAAEVQEPRRSVPSSSVPQTSKVKRGMSFDDAFDAAWDEASK